MITITLDTNIVAYLLKGLYDVEKKIKAEISNGNKLVINPITYYEVCRGLIAINSSAKLHTFKEICELFGVVELTKASLERSAVIYADLKNKGLLIEDADIFIGAICLENNYTLVTNNEKHFSRIDGLKYINWT